MMTQLMSRYRQSPGSLPPEPKYTFLTTTTSSAVVPQLPAVFLSLVGLATCDAFHVGTQHAFLLLLGTQQTVITNGLGHVFSSHQGSRHI